VALILALGTLIGRSYCVCINESVTIVEKLLLYANEHEYVNLVKRSNSVLVVELCTFSSCNERQFFG